MDALQRSFSAIKRCKNAVWKSIKKNSSLSCFRRCRSSMIQCTIENVLDGVTAIAAENEMLHETLTAAKTIGEMERTSAAMNSSKTEEKKQPKISDTEGHSRNIEIEEIKKKKRKRGNRKRRNNVRSQNAIKEQIIEGEGDETKSFDPSPISLIEETASVETVSNVIPSVVNNETECPETRGCDNGNIGDGKMIQFRETASAETMSDVSLRVECVNNNATERSDIRKSGNCFNGAADQRSQTLHETLTAAKTIGEMEQTSAYADEAMNSSKTEEKKQPEISTTEGQSRNVENEEIKIKKSKRGNRKRRKNVQSQNAIKEQIIEDKGEETNKIDPSPINSTEGTASAETMPNISLRVERVNNNATECSDIRKSENCYNGAADQHSQTKPVIKISSTGEGITRRKVVHMYLSSNKNVVLDKTENAWVPAIAARRAVTDAGGDVAVTTNNESNANEETNKSVRSILNKLTSENIDELIKSFKALPLNTIERLENAVDLVFERAIQEQSFAPLYAVLCSAMQSVQVTCAERKETALFKSLIIKKCQCFFESDKAHQTNSAKKLEEIKSCKDPEKKEELQFGYSENERKLRKRFVGNCCFIGELFNRHVVHPKIMQYCIAYLIYQRSEDSIECLCTLLRTSGKELEQWCNLNETFNNLKALASVKNMPSRIRFMIQDIVELRRNKWLPRTGVGK